jgi:hypothetical protein
MEGRYMSAAARINHITGRRMLKPAGFVSGTVDLATVLLFVFCSGCFVGFLLTALQAFFSNILIA